jgi:hypothetical protein
VVINAVASAAVDKTPRQGGPPGCATFNHALCWAVLV